MNALSTSQTYRLYAYLAISALVSLATWMLLLLPVFLQERGWSSQEIGWVLGSYFLINLVAQIGAGQIANRYGNIPTALWGAALAVVGGAFYLTALWSPGLIFPARFFHAIGTALVSAAAVIQLVNSVPQRLRGRMIGYFGLPGFVMLGIGPLFSEWFVYRWGFEGTFAAVPLIFIVVAFILRSLPRELTASENQRSFTKALRATIPNLRPVLAFSVFFGFCFSAWHSFMAPAVHSLGAGAVSGFSGGYGLGAVLTRLGLSDRLDTGSRRLAAISTLLGYSVALALIPRATTTWHLMVLGLICGTSHGIYYPSLSSIAAKRFPADHTGPAMSLYISASSLGMFIGPPIWGALADKMGYTFIFACAGGVLALSTATFVIIQWRQMALMRSSGTSTWETPLKEKRSLIK